MADLGSVFILSLFDHFPSHLKRAVSDSEPSKGETVAPVHSGLSYACLQINRLQVKGKVP